MSGQCPHRRRKIRHSAISSAEYAAARILDTDPRYVRCRCKGFARRSRQAILSEFVEQRFDGSLAPPFARLTGLATSVTVTSIGERSTASGAAGRMALLVNTDIGFNMLQEFWPEIRRTLFRRK